MTDPEPEYNVYVDVPVEPLLGLATTRQLLEEIQARGEVSATIGEYPELANDMAMGAARLLDDLPGSMLNYRTVDERVELGDPDRNVEL